MSDNTASRTTTEAALTKARSRTLMAAKSLSRLMAEFGGEIKYCGEALTELLDAADQLEAVEDYAIAQGRDAPWPPQ